MNLPDQDEFDEFVHRAEAWDLPLLREMLRLLESWLEVGNSWDDVFEAYDDARQALRDFESDLVRRARLDGENWDAVAGYLGLSRTGAQKRHQKLGIDELDALDDLHEAQQKALIAEVKLGRIREGAEPGSNTMDEATWNRLNELWAAHSAERSSLRRELERRDA